MNREKYIAWEHNSYISATPILSRHFPHLRKIVTGLFLAQRRYFSEESLRENFNVALFR
jgi:hypothetical protein